MSRHAATRTAALPQYLTCIFVSVVINEKHKMHVHSVSEIRRPFGELKLSLELNSDKTKADK